MLPVRKELFWETEFRKLDPEIHKRLIIERILTLGNIEEFVFLLNTYNNQTLVETIRHLGYLDPKTLSFVVSFFNLNKNDLRCYIKKQSAAPHWI